MRMMTALVTAALAGGCGGAAVSDYQIRLNTRTPIDQNPWSDGPAVKVIIRQGDGSFEPIEFLGILATGSIVGANFPPLDEAYIGVLLEEPGGNKTKYNAELLVAYGEAGPFSMNLVDDDSVLEVDMLLPMANSVGTLAELPESRFGAAVALTSNGRAYVFGGASATRGSSNGSRDVYMLADLDLDAWTFIHVGQTYALERSNATFPTDAGPIGAAAVTFIDNDGVERILVAGGIGEWGVVGPNSQQWMIWDPESNAMVASGKFIAGKSWFDMVSLPDGRIILASANEAVNGSVSAQYPSLEYFDPAKRQSTKADDNLDGVGPYHFALTSIGASDTVVCGGAVVYAENNQVVGWDPVDTCLRLTATGTVQPFPALPIPLFGHTMTRLSDDRILLAGGVTGRSTAGLADGPATDRVWVYEPADAGAGWVELGSMTSPRALHRTVATYDGRAIILGGGTVAGINPPMVDTAAPECHEIFDATDETFTAMSNCSAPGRFGMPAVAYERDQGVVTLAGVNSAGDGDSGEAFGVVVLGPRDILNDGN